MRSLFGLEGKRVIVLGGGFGMGEAAERVAVTPRAPLGNVASERAAMALVPMQRRGTVEDIVKAIVFFLSSQAAYVTGQTLAVDGGLTAVGPIDYSRFASTKGIN
jgi:uncharacterized protein with ACT and thioredoxin-like domain